MSKEKRQENVQKIKDTFNDIGGKINNTLDKVNELKTKDWGTINTKNAIDPKTIYLIVGGIIVTILVFFGFKKRKK